MKGSGTMEKNMEKVRLLFRLDNQELVNGEMI